MSMAHSLEVRVPFLDPHVAELALALPTSGEGARTARRSGCCGRSPRRCCRARSRAARKRGFSIPMAAWLRGPLLPLARDLLAPGALARDGLLDRRPSRGCSTSTSRAATTYSRALWGLLSLALWADR